MLPRPENVQGFCELFQKYSIPSAFIEESLQDVSQSFAAQTDAEGALYIWFHFLSKDISLVNGRIVHRTGSEDYSDSHDQARLAAQRQSQANFTWVKPGFVLKMRSKESAFRQPGRTRSSTSDITLAEPSAKPQVEMFCFGAPNTLLDRFKHLTSLATCEDLLLDPYCLLEIVLEEMYKIMDQTGWTIGDVFGVIETVCAACLCLSSRICD